VKFQQREGHANVPKSHKEDEKNLGIWFHAQKELKRKGELDISIQERLEDAGVIWDFFKKQREKRL